MADVGFRDLIGSIAPGRRAEPSVAPPSRDMAPPVEHAPAAAGHRHAPAAARAGPVRSLTGTPPTRSGLDPTFARLAELALHRRTGTPVTIGILGAGRAAARASRWSAPSIAGPRHSPRAAEKTASNSPFVSRVHVAKIDAASAFTGDPGNGAGRRNVHAGLRGPYPDLAREIGHGARDPHAALREANDKLDESPPPPRFGERRALDDAGSRRARLVETVLYETSGSAVDAYARARTAPGWSDASPASASAATPIRSYKDHRARHRRLRRQALPGIARALRLQGPDQAHRVRDPARRRRHRARHRPRDAGRLARQPARRPPGRRRRGELDGGAYRPGSPPLRSAAFRPRRAVRRREPVARLRPSSSRSSAAPRCSKATSTAAAATSTGSTPTRPSGSTRSTAMSSG